MKLPNRKAIIQELRHQLYYSHSPEERAILRTRLDFWLNYIPKQD